MTSNQIAYTNLVEQSRHNLAGEQETNRHNIATEYEQNRTNTANESLRTKELKETKRSHKANERENKRANLAREGLSQLELAEKQRANMANEANQQAATAAQKYAAYMHYLGTVTSSQISAQASNYAADMNKLVHKLDNAAKEIIARRDDSTKKWTTKQQNKMQKQIKQMQITADAIENSKDRYLDAVKAGNDKAAAKAQIELKKQMAEIDKMYKQGTLNYQQYKMMLDTLSNLKMSPTPAS